MKTRGIKDLYLPRKIAIHAKLVLFCVLSTIFFWIISGRGTFFEKTFYTFILTVAQIEAFWHIGVNLEKIWNALFRRKPISEKSETKKDITISAIIGWIFFYILCVISAFIIFICFSYVLYFFKGWNLKMVFPDFFRYEFWEWFKSINIGMSIGTFIFIVINWQQALDRVQKLKEEKLIFKYETLKNQVNPHFLFNSLNTLSSLISTNTELAETFIQKLSSIYRFVLEFKEVDLIPLEMELRFVRDYFYLQQIRDENKIRLEVQVTDLNYKIIPISLQILVENALKHNSASVEKPLVISVIQDTDKITVRNNLQKKQVFKKSSGTGLENLKERVKYIAKKEIEVCTTENAFIVTIPLIISK